MNMKCFNCKKKIKETYFKCLDNWLQAKFFEYSDERDNIFCTKECFCEYLSLEELKLER